MEQSCLSLVGKLMSGAGFYSWSVPSNTLTADRAFAEIYEIDHNDLARGVSLEFILDRIIEEDRPRLAGRIHSVILGGPPALSPYRIRCPSGTTKSLLSMGSCSTDTDGVPAFYSGIVLVEREIKQDREVAGLKETIASAISTAKAEELELTERYLSSALRSLSFTDR
jgi:PAS domain-containing protein